MDYFKIVDDNNLYSSTKRLKFYLNKILFKDIDFKDKTVIDIGGGNGLYSFYAALNGAKKVVVMEPEMDGSSEGFEKEFLEYKAMFGNPENIIFNKEFLQDYKPKEKYDVALMHYSINHLDEPACEVLVKDINARKKYLSVLEDFTQICSEKSTIIITDASRHNFFQFLGVKNPIVPTIEWEKHNDPKVWRDLLSEVGYSNPRIKWLALNAMGNFGNILFGNKIGSYFLHSHFYLRMDLIKSE